MNGVRPFQNKYHEGNLLKYLKKSEFGSSKYTYEEKRRTEFQLARSNAIFTYVVTIISTKTHTHTKEIFQLQMQ